MLANELMVLVKRFRWLLGLVLFVYLDNAFAVGSDMNIGQLATQTVKGSVKGMAQLISAGAVVAGMGFAVSAIMKFKAHKDNPAQVPVGTPIALLFIAAALMFLPSIFNILGSTIFGSAKQSGGLNGSNSFIRNNGQ